MTLDPDLGPDTTEPTSFGATPAPSKPKAATKPPKAKKPQPQSGKSAREKAKALLEEFDAEKGAAVERVIKADDDKYQYFVQCASSRKPHHPGIFLVGNPEHTGSQFGDDDWYSTYKEIGEVYDSNTIPCQVCLANGVERYLVVEPPKRGRGGLRSKGGKFTLTGQWKASHLRKRHKDKAERLKRSEAGQSPIVHHSYREKAPIAEGGDL